MNTNKTYFVLEKIEKLNVEIWNIKHLLRILNELICNDTGNLTNSDICTLSEIIVRTVNALSNQSVKLQQKLEKRYFFNL